MKYDAIIAGASFAGLAAARVLRGNILLIDRKSEIGAEQTSTCCTYEHIIKKLGCESAILQIIETLILHFDSEDVVGHLNEPFATIDYKKFCQFLIKNSQGQFLSAKIRGLQGDKVITDKGEFQSDCIIDATGWPAVLASSIKKDFVKKNDQSFGMEALPSYKNKVIEIWVNPKFMKKGVTWIFPCGQFSRMGIASYLGKTNLKEGLETFLKNFGLKITDDLHSGFFTHRLREPTIGNLFLVGDSGGQCLPLTGEGIRSAIYFGEKCGKIIQQIIEGKKTLKEGQKEYSHLVKRKKKYYTFLSGLEKLFITLPNIFSANFAKFINGKLVFKYAEKKYLKLWVQ